MKIQNNIVIQVTDLVKQYKDITAVNGISFDVHEGEIFGIVGPNGAGKTTTLECLEGMRTPDSGSVKILGLDPRRDRYSLQERIGVQLQTSFLQHRMKVWEALDLFSSFYSRSVDRHRLLEQLGLVDKANARFSQLSGGQRQRLFIALALVNDPYVVFLDELTTGLDPHARRSMWDLVRKIRDQGKTVLLTTHYMEEAEQLCDRVAIMDNAKIAALDSPENLIKLYGSLNCIQFNVSDYFSKDVLKNVLNVERIEQSNGRVKVYGTGEYLVNNVVNALSSENIGISNIQTEQPSLDDVFLALTGRKMEKEGGI